MTVNDTHDVVTSSQGRSRWSGWSGFDRTTISQGKNKFHFYRKQVIDKRTRACCITIQYIEKAYDEVENN